MCLYERIIAIINEKGLNVKKVERESGLSNASIKKWKEQTPSLDSISKLATYLDVSIDYLAFGSRNLSTDVIAVNEEITLLEMYRVLDDRDKNDAFEILKLKYERSLNKKGFTYSHQESDTDSGDNTADGIA